MFDDARSLTPGTRLSADLCIVGAGPAGITLAREFAGSGLRVCVLESGGLEAEAATQALYAGENAGLPYHPLDRMRLRYFGGTSNHWAGWCRPPRAFDFPPRAWIPHSGWPFAFDEIRPYLPKAHEICRLGPYDYRPEYWADAPARRPLPFDRSRVLTAVTQFSPPARFGREFRAELEHAPNLAVWLHANAVRIDTDEAAREVAGLHAACLNGVQFTVSARHYVLATGGIENARLLLASDHVARDGLGNGNGLVGRFFMDHIKFEAARFQPARADLPMAYYLRHAVRGTEMKGQLCLAEALLRRERLLECYFEFAPARAEREPGLDAEVGMGIVDTPVTREPPRPWSVMLRIDPAPNPDSRVTLASERDALGLRRPRLAWSFGALERRSFDRAIRLLALEVGRAGLGRLQLKSYDEAAWPPPPGIAVPTGFHHMGTTRMHRDPRQGVVDENGRVHGMRNLHVAGSSVFPNYEGYPTLMIVALALRLAQRLKGLLS